MKFISDPMPEVKYGLIIVDAIGEEWYHSCFFETVEEAFGITQDIFYGLTIWNPEQIRSIVITDLTTGEIVEEYFEEDILKTKNEKLDFPLDFFKQETSNFENENPNSQREFITIYNDWTN